MFMPLARRGKVFFTTLFRDVVNSWVVWSKWQICITFCVMNSVIRVHLQICNTKHRIEWGMLFTFTKLRYRGRNSFQLVTYNIVNSSPPGQNGRHFADDLFRCIFVNEHFRILNKITLKFVPSGLIDNNSALLWIMAWRRLGDKPLSEPMLTRSTDAYMRH